MFPYRVEYTESEYDIQDNDLLYKINKNAKIYSKVWKISKIIETFKFVVCYMYKFHNLYFVIFVDFVFF